ncbi:MAG: MFS transporter [Acutalibacteraceae bacterium]|nr:MFS transporter [Oscillospiraceae bacterium]
MGNKLQSGSKLSARIWFNLCIFGFIGQVAWNLENMYFNTFLYNTVYDKGTVTQGISSMKAIQLMVALSAVTAVVTTFLMGNLSDKINKRKVFISVGYIIWGVTVLVFGFITKDNIATIFGIDKTDIGAVVTATSVTVIAMDCLMTFMGSTSNDSAFNAWVTDITTPHNRATVESVLGILPVAAMLFVIVLAGFINDIGYRTFFFIIGAMVIVAGVIGLFTLTDSGSGVKKNDNYFKELFYGFRPSVVKENSKLYLALVTICIYSIAIQVWFPYLLIYMEHTLNFNIENLMQYLSVPVVLGIVVVAAAAVAVLVFGGKLIDKKGKDNLVFICAALFIVGLVLASFAKRISIFFLCAIPLFLGYGFMGIMLNATIRDFTPEDKVGLFQGVRMIFFVLIPMVVGPYIGDLVCSLSKSGQYVNEFGESTYEPCSSMFLAAAIVAMFMFIPLIILRKKGFAVEEKKTEAAAE